MTTVKDIIIKQRKGAIKMENNFNKFGLEDDDEDIEIDLSGWKLNENFQQEENDRISMLLKEMKEIELKTAKWLPEEKLEIRINELMKQFNLEYEYARKICLLSINSTEYDDYIDYIEDLDGCDY